MKARPFSREHDGGTLQKWCAWWKVLFPLELLPEYGVIVDDLALGFVYETNSPVVFLEPLLTNPKAERLERRDALDVVMEALTKYAEGRGYRLLVGMTAIESQVARAETHGYTADPRAFTVLRKVVHRAV